MSFFSYLRNVRAEMQHVVWPSHKQTLQHVGVVICISIVMAIITAALDFGFGRILANLIGF